MVGDVRNLLENNRKRRRWILQTTLSDQNDYYVQPITWYIESPDFYIDKPHLKTMNDSYVIFKYKLLYHLALQNGRYALDKDWLTLVRTY